MVDSQQVPGQVGASSVRIALVLLLGIIILGWGYSAGNRIGFYVGLLVTLAGVLTGIVRVVLPRGR